MAVLFWVIVLLILCFGTTPVIEWIQRWPELVVLVQHWLTQGPTAEALLGVVAVLVLVALVGIGLLKGLFRLGQWISPPAVAPEPGDSVGPGASGLPIPKKT